MDNQQLSNIRHIKEASNQGRLVVFVGAGVSKNSGVPLWSELISAMKEEMPKSISGETDYLKVAQVYKDSRDHKEYMDLVKKVLKHNKVIPNDIHKAILALKPCHIVTTNYDDLLEQEIQNELKQYALVREDKDIPNMHYPNSLIKMHGDYITDNIVLTENDYYDYARKFPLIRSFVFSLFASKLVLFVGFSFTDLNLKVILNDLRSILSDNMQRAYLISIDCPDDFTKKYYEEKGINIVYLDDSELEISKGYNVDIKDVSGKKVWNVLNIINLYSDYYNLDLIGTIYEKLSLYENEIIDIGENGLKYLLHKDEDYNFNYSKYQLLTGHEGFVKILNSLKSKKGIKQFIISHPKIDLRKLRQFAYYNSVYSINSVEIVSYQFLKRIRKIKTSAIDYLYDFSFNEFKTKLKFLSARNRSCSRADLEYPFVLYKLGDYYGAYKIYEELLSFAWNKQKFILYFICLYNMQSICYGVEYQLSMSYTDSNVDINKVISKVKGVNLDEVLSRLPIEEWIRKMFQDLISYRSIGNVNIKTKKINESIYRQRNRTEKKGVAVWNYDIYEIIGVFSREFNFCNNNFIICDNNPYYHAMCKDTICVLLNSYATPSISFDKKFEQPKIEKLDSLALSLMIFLIEPIELIRIFETYNIDSIAFDENAENLLHKYLCNINEFKNIPYINKLIFIYQLQNLLCVISHTKIGKTDMSVVYDVIIKYWDEIKKLFDISILSEILRKFESNLIVANELLDKLIEYNSEKSDIGSGVCIQHLVSLFKEKGWSYNNWDFCKKVDFNYVYIIYPIIPDLQKKKFADQCLANIDNVSNYLSFISNNKLQIASSERLSVLLNKHSKLDIENEIYCCYLMGMILKNNQYPCLNQVIQDYSMNNECLKFFIDPIEYDKPNEVQVKWLLRCEDVILSELIKRLEYREKIKQSLLTGEIPVKERIIKLL